MFNISKNGIVTVSRGDSFSIDVFVNLSVAWDPVVYNLVGEDKLYFALMEPNQPFECAIMRKVFTKKDFNMEKGVIEMNFEPEMTEYLMPGTYYYMVKLVTEDNDVTTIISKTRFNIID